MNDSQGGVDPNKLSDVELTKMVECFGYQFQKSDPTCMSQCEVRDRCIGRMHKVTIPQIMGIRGPKTSASEVAGEIGSDEESIEVVVRVAQGEPIDSLLAKSSAQEPAEVIDIETKRPVLEVVRDTVEDSEDDLEEESVEEPESVEEEEEPEVTAPGEPETVPEPTKPLPDTVEDSAPKEKGPKKKAKVKAKPKAKDKVKVARTRAPKKPSAPTKPVVDLEIASLDSAEFEGAFIRERKKSPLIEMLEPGQTLVRDYKPRGGEPRTVKVKVKKDRYVFEGREYPTLYSIVLEVTGARECLKQAVNGVRREGTRVTSNWSATRFFRLMAAE